MMGLYRYILIPAITFCLSTNVIADTLKSPLEARELTNKVMSKMDEGDIESGLLLLKPYSIVPPAEYDVLLDKLKMQLPVMSQRFGNSIGHEFIRDEKSGENILRITQIHRFEKHPMRWCFYFYQGKNGWVLNTFITDDDIRQLF
ncbi:MAG: hypothetical protein ABL859_11510 [Methylotenera sp.]